MNARRSGTAAPAAIGTRRTLLSGALAAACAPRVLAGARRGADDSIAVSGAMQMNGVAQALDGRIFVSMPRWSQASTPSVAVLSGDHELRPYPGGAWHDWRTNRSPENSFVCVNTLRIDPPGSNDLWVVDAGAPAFDAIVSGAPKLVRIDISSGRVVRSYGIDASVTGPHGYLNDVRFAGGHAFLSESGEGAIIALDLSTGHARRLLSKSASTKAVPGRTPTVDGREVRRPDGSIPKVNVDGLELSLDKQWVLFAVPFGGWLWRVSVADLVDTSLSADELDRRVQRLGPLMPIGGTTAAPDGGLFLSDVEHHAIVHRSASGTLRTIRTDPRLRWPDASAIDPGGALLVAASQVSGMPAFNRGQDAVVKPFQVLRVPVGARPFTPSQSPYVLESPRRT